MSDMRNAERGASHSVSVLGETRSWSIPGIAGSDWTQFVHPSGIRGLARETETARLDILAVESRKPGSGALRAFLDDMETSFLAIVIHQVMNPRLAEFLRKRGFTETEVMMDGERVQAMAWINDKEMVL